MRIAPVIGLSLLALFTLPARAEDAPAQDAGQVSAEPSQSSDVDQSQSVAPEQSPSSAAEQSQSSTSEESRPQEPPAPPTEATAAGSPDAATVPVVPVRDEAASAPEAKEGESTQRLDDIVVTATKRAKSVRDIPLSITGKSGEDLEKQGARDILDYISQLPGITMQEGSNGDAGGRNVTVRGVGPDMSAGSITQQSNQTVGQFIGDIPMTDPYSNFVTPDLDPFDLETVEVLKGPQGTYFGASALNGAIRYVPNRPELGVWNARGFVDVTRIRYGGTAPVYAAGLNAPVGDEVALRASGVLQRTSGLIDNLQRETPDADSVRKWSGRGSLLWQPTERLSIGALYLKQQTTKNDLLVVDNGREEFTNNTHPGPSSIRTGFSLSSLDLRYEFDDWGTLIWQSSRQTKSSLGDFDGTIYTGDRGVQNIRGYLNADVHGTTHELRLVSPDDGKWTWIAGLFLLRYHADVINDAYVANTSVLGPVAGLPVAGFVQGPRGLSYGIVSVQPDAEEKSFYGELSRKLGDDWELTLGARVYRTELAGVIYFSGAGGALFTEPFVVDEPDHGISPKISLVYKPSRSLMTYATVSRGFQFGGINAQTSVLPVNNPLTGPPPPPTFRSSNLWSREVGVRTEWLDRTLRADFTVYDLDWSDAQVAVYTDNLVVDTQPIENVGKVRSQGIESTLSWLTPLNGLSLNLAVARARARTAEPFVANGGREVPAGSAMPGTPRWQFASTLAYATSFGDWQSSAGLIHTYSSRAYNNIFHEHEIFNYAAMNLNFSVARPDLPFAPSLALGINNLADRRGIIGRTPPPGTASVGTTNADAGGPGYIYIRPRTLSLRLTAEFK